MAAGNIDQIGRVASPQTKKGSCKIIVVVMLVDTDIKLNVSHLSGRFAIDMLASKFRMLLLAMLQIKISILSKPQSAVD